MNSTVNRIICLGIFLISSTGFGSGLRVVTQPQPVTFSTKELNISCIVDEPAYLVKSVFSISITRHDDDKPIAVINLREELKMAAGAKPNMKAEGHIDNMKTNTSYLNLTIDKPDRKDVGSYMCLLYFIDNNFHIVEENTIGNVTYQGQDSTDVITHLTRNVSRILATVLILNNTLQTQAEEHIVFNKFHSQQKTNMDTLTDKIDTENMTNTEQNIELDNLKDYQSRQKQDIDILTDTIDRQNKTNMKQSEQIDLLNKDNTKKQQELETLISYIQQQNETIKKNEFQIRFMMKEIVSIDQNWKLYEADQTFVKAFGKVESSKHLSWSKARETCQTFGGDLVEIHDEDKNTFVYNLFEGTRHFSVWIGVRNHAYGGYDFKYVNGSDLVFGDFDPWNAGQPNGYGYNDEICVAMTINHSGKWWDTYCSSPGPYACSVSALGVL